MIKHIDDARIDKSLFTSRGHGTTPTLYECGDEWREADVIADEIERLIAYGGGQLTYNDIAILRKFQQYFCAASTDPAYFSFSLDSKDQCHLASYRGCVPATRHSLSDSRRPPILRPSRGEPVESLMSLVPGKPDVTLGQRSDSLLTTGRQPGF